LPVIGRQLSVFRIKTINEQTSNFIVIKLISQVHILLILELDQA